MPYGTTTINETPQQGMGANHFSGTFCGPADACLGIYHAKRMQPPPKGEESDDSISEDGDEDDDAEVEEMNERKRLRGRCSTCSQQTEYFCHGCRRWLCNIPPRKEKKAKKSSTKVKDKYKKRKWENKDGWWIQKQKESNNKKKAKTKKELP